jgi:hypothetical protein
MQAKSPRNREQGGGIGRDKVPDGKGKSAAKRTPARGTEVTDGNSAHEVHDGKLVKKPTTESGKQDCRILHVIPP